MSKHISEFEKGSDFKLNVDKLNSIFDNIQKKFNRFVEISEYIYLFNLNANLDSIKLFSFVDSIGGIEFLPSRALRNKFANEEAFTVDQNIIYPSKCVVFIDTHLIFW